MVPFEDVVRLNQYAQRIRSMDDAMPWFSALSEEQKQDVLRQLAVMFQQAHASSSEVLEAISLSGLKATYTPCVLMTHGPIGIQAAKVISLPEQERGKAFQLFIALVGVSESRRRRTDCVGGCSHWWHQDLSNDLVVRRIITEH